MISHLMLSATTFCNPMSIPDMPLGAYCRHELNGTEFPARAWSQRFWQAGINNGGTMKQHRELADPVTYAEGDTWYLYPSCGLMWKSVDSGGTWEHVRVQEEADYAPAVQADAVRITVTGGPKGIIPALSDFAVFGTR